MDCGTWVSWPTCSSKEPPSLSPPLRISTGNKAVKINNIIESQILTKIYMYCDIYQGLEGLIFGIQDLTKIRCRNQINDKFTDGIRDLTVPREARLTKNWARVRDLCLRVCRKCRKPSRLNSSCDQSKSTRRALIGVSFQIKHPMECLVNRSFK